MQLALRGPIRLLLEYLKIAMKIQANVVRWFDRHAMIASCINGNLNSLRIPERLPRYNVCILFLDRMVHHGRHAQTLRTTRGRMGLE
jgi:hypothetical protein